MASVGRAVAASLNTRNTINVRLNANGLLNKENTVSFSFLFYLEKYTY